MDRFAIYGAYGYAGRAAAEHAVELGLKPLLLGRNDERLTAIANSLALESATVAIGNREELRESLGEVDAVLNCAGPFIETTMPLVEACLASGTHYLDIGGEIGVLNSLAGLAQRFVDAGIVVMPSAGFDVVPSDCLAVHLRERLPSATSLTIAFDANTPPSRGSVRTGLRSLSGAVVRKEGVLVTVPYGSKHRQVDFGFGRGERHTHLVRWGDVVTAHHSVGVGEIDVYAVVSKRDLRTLRAGKYVSKVLQLSPVEAALTNRLTGGRPGPAPEDRDGSLSWFHVALGDRDGRTAEARLQLPHPYTFTARASVEATTRVSQGKVRAGFVTPAQGFGPDFILDFDGVSREDIA